MVFLSTIIMLLQKVIPDEYLQKWGFSLQKDEIRVDEDLPNFFSAVRLN